MKKEINNIVVFTNTLNKGGAETQAVELAKVLSDRYKVWLVIFYGNQINLELISRLDGYLVNIVHFSGSKVKCVFEFINLIQKEKIDCIYSFLATTNLYAGVLGRFCGVRYIIGGIRNSSYKGVKLLIQRALHNSFMTTTISNNYSAIEPLSRAGFKESKFNVIHNVFPAPMKEYSRVDSEEFIIITVARFNPQKDYETSLKSVALLRAKYPDVEIKYLIIGFGSQEAEIRQMVTYLKLDDIVEIKVNPNNIFENLVNSDIYLSTSLFEGTSNSILEAMYAGLPVVATDVGDNSYMVKEQNGFLTEIKDVKTISEKLALLLQDDVLRKDMGKNSRTIVEDDFSLSAFAQNNFDLLNRLIDEK